MSGSSFSTVTIMDIFHNIVMFTDQIKPINLPLVADLCLKLSMLAVQYNYHK